METYAYSFDELSPELQAFAGGKGGSLAKLYQSGFPVPEGFVIVADAFAEDRLLPEAWEQVKKKLDLLRKGVDESAFAVRSSAMSEDSAQTSFAGEFESRLNISTDEEIREAIHEVYLSRHGEKVQAYSQARGITDSHKVAVVIQRLVPADRSGVMFTANPTNGDRTQVMISAAWGLGEAIVSGTVTPDTFIVDKDKQRVTNRQIATKQVMTVRKVGGTEDHPVEGEKQRQAVLSDAESVRLAKLGAQIEAQYGMPMDIEWAASQGNIFILQARPITAIPDPPVPTTWKLPKGGYAAMRVNIIELMAEPLSPLFETMGVEVINAGMGEMMTGFLGRPDILPENPIITVNHYAYYNGSIKPVNIARLLFDSVGIARRMFTKPVERWTEQGKPQYLSIVEKWKDSNWLESSNVEILHTSRELTKAAIDAYWSMVGGVLPAAWISEALFTFVYRILIKRRGDPDAPAFLLGFDSAPIRADKALYDLATWAREHEALSDYLADTQAGTIVEDLGSGETLDGMPELAWFEWQRKFQEHLEQYGHMVYDLDYANPVPADDPFPLLETLKLYLSGEGTNPHERQGKAIDRREAAESRVRNRFKGWRLRQFERFLALAQRFAPLREDALSDVGLAYPLLRRMLRHIGSRLTQAGAIERPEDIYWLTQEEVRAACEKLDRDLAVENLSKPISERKAAIRSAEKASPPMRLPHLSLPWLKNLTAILLSRREQSILEGVGASAGLVTAKACVLHGPEDFDQMESGDILVAKLTTPAWTPLFARAAAIVTDVGGPLSHGSIVAREYNIPAVLGTGKATQRIQSGQRITVDGNKGKVYLQPNGNRG